MGLYLLLKTIMIQLFCIIVCKNNNTSFKNERNTIYENQKHANHRYDYILALFDGFIHDICERISYNVCGQQV